MAGVDLTNFLNALKMSGEEAFTASGSRPEASRATAVPLPDWATQAPRQTADQTPSLASSQQGGVHQGWAERQKFREDRDAAVARGGALDPSTWGFKTPGGPNELYDSRMAREVKARGGEFRSPPAQALPAWAGQSPSQAPSQPYAPPQLALGAPIGAVSPVQVNNQALVNALRAPAAPQAIGGNNG